MSPFGPRVIGETAYAAAQSAQKIGANIFGPRVVGTIPARNGSATVKPVAGPQVVGATPPVADSLSVTQLKTVLTQNPTTLDSLFEAELVRPEGARLDALNVFLTTEMGARGQRRPEFMAEIKELIAAKHPASTAVTGVPVPDGVNDGDAPVGSASTDEPSPPPKVAGKAKGRKH